MNWDDIRIFLSIARTGQILAAARRLGLNHATVARRLTALEESVGTRLFDRSTSGCQLTDAGNRFFDRAERMEAEAVAAEADLGHDTPEISGTVRIGAPDGFGVAYLAPRLGELTEKHPGLTVQLVPVPRSFSLSRREADIAVTIDRPETGRLVAGKLVTSGMSLRELEGHAIEAALERNQGNKSAAAEELGISLKTLYNKINQGLVQNRAA